MIDTHLHILPGVDDGPETMDETIALARVLVQEGVRVAISTPHYNDQYPQRSAAEIWDRANQVQRALNYYGIPLRICPGHEALIKPGLVEDIQKGRVATLNGSRYLLLELWTRAWLPETERVIFELRAAGIIPILAHPERYLHIQQHPDRLASLLQQGVLAQLTANSLIGFWGKTIQRSAETLLKKKLIHCIATDSHGLRKRPPALGESLKRAERLLGQAGLRQVVETWPTAILNNQTSI